MSNQRLTRSARTAAGLAALFAGVGGWAGPARAAGPSLPVRGVTGGALNASAERLILVTIANDSALTLSEPGSTPHGYDAIGFYGVSDQAKAIGAALGRDYGLQPVRDWPIAPLGGRCLGFG